MSSSRYSGSVETKKAAGSTPNSITDSAKGLADRVTLNSSDLALRRYHIPLSPG